MFFSARPVRASWTALVLITAGSAAVSAIIGCSEASKIEAVADPPEAASSAGSSGEIANNLESSRDPRLSEPRERIEPLDHLAELQSALLAGKIDKQTYDELKADLKVGTIAVDASGKPVDSGRGRSEGSANKEATIIYWRSCYYALNRMLRFGGLKPEATAELLKAVQRLPTKGVESTAVETMLEMSEFFHAVALAGAYAESPDFLLESFLRGAGGDPFGATLDLQAKGNDLGRRAERLVSTLSRAQATLTEKYDVEFSQLPPLYRDVAEVDTVTDTAHTAARALKPGDVIEAVAGAAVSTPAEAVERIDAQPQGQKYSLAYRPAGGVEIRVLEVDGGRKLGVALRAGVVEIDLDLRADKPSAQLHNELAIAAVNDDRHEVAVQHADHVLRSKPDAGAAAVAYGARGYAYQSQSKWKEAVSNYDIAIALNSQDATFWGNRGRVQSQLEHVAAAHFDLTKALELSPNNVDWLVSRGHINCKLKKWSDARNDLDRATVLSPSNVQVLNGLGWLLATCPDESIRDSGRAVEHARNACDLTGWSDPVYFDTLAAAYAADGDFAKAREWQQKAIPGLEKMPGFAKAEVDKARQRLGLYQMNQAYLEK